MKLLHFVIYFLVTKVQETKTTTLSSYTSLDKSETIKQLRIDQAVVCCKTNRCDMRRLQCFKYANPDVYVRQPDVKSKQREIQMNTRTIYLL